MERGKDCEQLRESFRRLRAALAIRRVIISFYCHQAITFTKEIARKLHMPASTVKSYFYRSLPQVRKALAADAPLAAVS